MGLGKTFTGSEKMLRLGGRVNLVICQKSKVSDWVEHFCKERELASSTFDLTTKSGFADFLREASNDFAVGVVNYDLVFRRPELLKLEFDTIMLDESSMIQNDRAKRTKAILKMKTDNVILLSGTPTGCKYEN